MVVPTGYVDDVLQGTAHLGYRSVLSKRPLVMKSNPGMRYTLGVAANMRGKSEKVLLTTPIQGTRSGNTSRGTLSVNSARSNILT